VNSAHYPFRGGVTHSSRPVVARLRLSMVMHVGNSGGSRAWQGPLGRRPVWGGDPPGQRVSATDRLAQAHQCDSRGCPALSRKPNPGRSQSPAAVLDTRAHVIPLLSYPTERSLCEAVCSLGF